jgi:hypothetical protein
MKKRQQAQLRKSHTSFYPKKIAEVRKRDNRYALTQAKKPAKASNTKKNYKQNSADLSATELPREPILIPFELFNPPKTEAPTTPSYQNPVSRKHKLIASLFILAAFEAVMAGAKKIDKPQLNAPRTTGYTTSILPV